MNGSKCIEFYYYMYGAQVYLKIILLAIKMFSLQIKRLVNYRYIVKRKQVQL